MSHRRISIPLSVEFGGAARLWQLRGQRLLDRRPPEGIPKCFEDVPTEPAGDAWVLRERFLSIQSPPELLDFLNRNGNFCSYVGVNFWTFRSMLAWQPLIRWMMGTPPNNWASGVKRHANDAQQEVLHRYESMTTRFWTKKGASIKASDVLGAILATVYVDAMTVPKKLGFCARPDCGKPFVLESNHKRLYCSYECAHLQSVRRARSRERGSTSRAG